MGDKFLAWVFGISAITTTYNVYLSNKDGNFDATFGWLTATCFALSALCAYLRIINKK
jgi:hypothetical protein